MIKVDNERTKVMAALAAGICPRCGAGLREVEGGQGCSACSFKNHVVQPDKGTIDVREIFSRIEGRIKNGEIGS